MTGASPRLGPGNKVMFMVLKVDALSQLVIEASSCMKDILSYTPRFHASLRNKG